jgi:NAD(P)-dependent dehydrogenase (short-subunit alcohol dehydrogenase family)
MSISPEHDTRFKGKHIVITGAGGNFGREGCIYFGLRGAKISALDVNQEKLNETVALLKSKLESAQITCFECNVTDPVSVQAAIGGAVEKYGTPQMLWSEFEKTINSANGNLLNIMCNLQNDLFFPWYETDNAGYQGEIKPTLEYSLNDFTNVMNINVCGMFNVLQTVAKKMAEENEQEEQASSLYHKYSIVNTASVAAMRGTPAMVAYSSSKAAILAMTVSSAKDLAPHGIRVNAISPALIGPGFMWDRQNELHAKSGSPYFASDPEEVAKGKINGVPMKRLGTIEEVVKSVAYLLSDESSYTTAFNLVVDGGMSGGLR